MKYLLLILVVTCYSDSKIQKNIIKYSDYQECFEECVDDCFNPPKWGMGKCEDKCEYRCDNDEEVEDEDE